MLARKSWAKTLESRPVEPTGSFASCNAMNSITLLTFSKTGRVKQLQLSWRTLLFALAFVVTTTLGSAFALFASLKGWIGTPRLAAFEEENRFLRSELQKQGAHLDKLRAELKRLKELEEQLKVLAGVQASPDPTIRPGKEAAGSSLGFLFDKGERNR